MIAYEQRRAEHYAWLVNTLAPGEPLWFFASGVHVPTMTAARAWAGLKGFGKSLTEEVRARGVFRTLAEATVVAAVDSVVGNPNASAAELVWPDRPGFPKPSLHGLAMGLTAQRLILVGTVGSQHPETFESFHAPAWVVSLLPEQLPRAKVRLRPYKFVKSEAIALSIGEGEGEESFHFDDLEAAGAIMERVSPLAGERR